MRGPRANLRLDVPLDFQRMFSRAVRHRSIYLDSRTVDGFLGMQKLVGDLQIGRIRRWSWRRVRYRSGEALGHF